MRIQMVGASCVNAVSEYTNLVIKTGGKTYQIDFAKGITTKKLYVIDESTEETGTEVTFKLDKEIWKEEWYDFNHVMQRLKQLTYLNPGLVVDVDINSHTAEGTPFEKKESYYCKEGLIGYLNQLTKTKAKLIEPEYISEKVPLEKQEVSVEVAYIYTDGFSTDIKSFVNNVGTEYGGDHETGYRTGLYNAIKRYATEYKLVKDTKVMNSDDCLEGMNAIISIKLKNPNFEGQGKGKLRMPEIRSLIKAVTEEYIYDYLNKDNKRAKVIIDKVISAGKAREAAKRARNAARGIKNAVSAGVVENFADCSCKDPAQCEVYFVEGKRLNCPR